jgi:hypothetical protein
MWRTTKFHQTTDSEGAVGGESWLPNKNIDNELRFNHPFTATSTTTLHGTANTCTHNDNTDHAFDNKKGTPFPCTTTRRPTQNKLPNNYWGTILVPKTTSILGLSTKPKPHQWCRRRVCRLQIHVSITISNDVDIFGLLKQDSTGNNSVGLSTHKTCNVNKLDPIRYIHTIWWHLYRCYWKMDWTNLGTGHGQSWTRKMELCIHLLLEKMDAVLIATIYQKTRTDFHQHRWIKDTMYPAVSDRRVNRRRSKERIHSRPRRLPFTSSSKAPGQWNLLHYYKDFSETLGGHCRDPRLHYQQGTTYSTCFTYLPWNRGEGNERNVCTRMGLIRLCCASGTCRIQLSGSAHYNFIIAVTSWDIHEIFDIDVFLEGRSDQLMSPALRGTSRK